MFLFFLFPKWSPQNEAAACCSRGPLTISYLLFYFLFLFYGFKRLCLPESQVQLGSGDGGADPRLFLLGLHRDANPWGIHLLQAGSEQVGGPSTWGTTDTAQPLDWLMKQYDFILSIYRPMHYFYYHGRLNEMTEQLVWPSVFIAI